MKVTHIIIDIIFFRGGKKINEDFRSKEKI